MVLSALLLTLAACTSGPEVHAELDRTADFSQYRTFAFISPLGAVAMATEHRVPVPQGGDATRSWKRAAPAWIRAHLLINFKASLDDKLRVTSAPMPMYGMGGYYGYRYGMYSPWPYYNDMTMVSSTSRAPSTSTWWMPRAKQMVCGERGDSQCDQEGPR
jgi:hypothetical protein